MGVVRCKEIGLGPFRFLDQVGELEDTGVGDAAEFPIDGIFGTQFLSACEWWFDDDNRIAWARPYDGR
jgi:hypothetical protein